MKGDERNSKDIFSKKYSALERNNNKRENGFVVLPKKDAVFLSYASELKA